MCVIFPEMSRVLPQYLLLVWKCFLIYMISNQKHFENKFKFKLFIGITSKATSLTNVQKHETWNWCTQRAMKQYIVSHTHTHAHSHTLHIHTCQSFWQSAVASGHNYNSNHEFLTTYLFVMTLNIMILNIRYCNLKNFSNLETAKLM